VAFRLNPFGGVMGKPADITISYVQLREKQARRHRFCYPEPRSLETLFFGGFVMKKLCGLLAVSISLMFVVYTPLALAQAQSQAPAEKVFEGALTKVDANARSLSIKGATGAEMTFNYTEQTQVLGPEKNIQGLAGKTGTRLKVTYSEQGGKLTAMKIESVERS
jgi:hypothetical protein